MKRPVRIALCLGAVAGGLVAVTVAISGMSPVATAAQEPCCFTNPRYTGVCQVTPGEDETCASILSYLNNPNSVGKAYCGNTKVRGGWQQVDCQQ